MTGFDSKRQAAQAKVNEDDDTQVYADTLLIVYQRGFADGKRAANAMHDLARLGQEIEQEQAEQCIGKDPRCPCQEGDACHYKDCGSTKALPVPPAQPEQEPVAKLFGTLPVFDTPLAAPVQEVDWKDQYEKQKRRSEMWVAKYEKDIGPLEYAVPVSAPVQEPVAWAVQGITQMIRGEFAELDAKSKAKRIGGTCVAYPLYTAPAQRPWVGLTDEDKKKIAVAAGCTDDDDGHIVTEIFRLAEAKLKEKNDH